MALWPIRGGCIGIAGAKEKASFRLCPPCKKRDSPVEEPLEKVRVQSVGNLHVFLPVFNKSLL